MLRWCFTQKINYMQRTISPNLLESIVFQFELQKKSILYSHLKYKYNTNTLPDEIWHHARLHINDGRLGYRFAADLTWSAYAASIFECSRLLDSIYPGSMAVIDSIHLPLPRASSSIGVLQDFHQRLRFLTNGSGVQYSVDYIRFLLSNRGAGELSDFEPFYDKSVQS